MGISDAFLRGQQVRNQADAQRLGLLSALINRPMAKTGSAALRGGGGGSRREPIESFEEQDVRKAEEARKASGQAMLEETHGKAMERGDLETDILRQAQTERETAASNKAVDRAKAEQEDISAGQIREGSRQDMLGYQEQTRHYKAYSDAIYRGDAAAADRHFRGIYPGMSGDTRPATVRRQLRDAEGKPVFDDNDEPVMQETKYGAEGKPMTEEEVRKQQASYPRHRSDGGIVYMQFGDETPVPIGPGRLRQIYTSIHPSMMTQAGGGGQAGRGQGVGGTKTMSAKDASVVALNNIKKGAGLVKSAVEFANSMPAKLAEGEEVDPYNPKQPSAQEHMENFLKGLELTAKLAGSQSQQEKMGLPRAIKALGSKASKQFARNSREWFDKTIEAGGPPPDIRQMIVRANKEHGLGAAHEMAKIFKAELTPAELTFEADNAKETPDFGHGQENVLHIYEKDIGPDGLGIAIDKTTKQPRRWDKNSQGWIPIEPQVLRAYVNLLNEKANQGDKDAEKMIAILEAPRMRPFSFKELMAPITSFAKRAGTAIGETVEEEAGAMGRWTEGGKPQEFGPKSDISLAGQ